MCGIFGIYHKSEDVANLIKQGLFQLQHRGQESAGIVVYDGNRFSTVKGLGLVNEALGNDKILKLKGNIGIGHVRYSTYGAKGDIRNAQPFIESHIALAHNGNILNASLIRKELEKYGMRFTSDTDSEVILKLYLSLGNISVEEKLKILEKRLKGAFALLILDQDKLIAYRDRHGFRPLFFGYNDELYAVGSETGSLKVLQINKIYEIKPGEAVVIDKQGVEKFTLMQAEPLQCIFELIYFSRADGEVFGENVYEFRKNSGKLLAYKEKHDIDLVIPVPDTGIIPALGYSEILKVPVEYGLLRNIYIGRSFIKPFDRETEIRNKFIPVERVIKGKRIAVIDDSIVRGTTAKWIVRILKEHGAEEVHLRIASPPLKFPCYWGIDIPTKEELVAGHRSIEEVRKYLGADSLVYLDIEELYKLVKNKESFCYECFTGNSPFFRRT